MPQFDALVASLPPGVDTALDQRVGTYRVLSAQQRFGGLALAEKDIISTWSGVRPVINTGKSDPSKESREHAIWNENGLITITGGNDAPSITSGVQAGSVTEIADATGAGVEAAKSRLRYAITRLREALADG
mgnify:CR=1 FL=1